MSTIQTPERTSSVDILRGIALCGILFINIIAFGRYNLEYINPSAAGPVQGLNLIAWYISSIFVEMKFVSIFSMLFGAGLVLLGDKLAAHAPNTSFAPIYYRRVLWLIVFGTAHAWLFWYGDILFHYGLCGLLLYPLRNLKPRTLLIIGLITTLPAVLIYAGIGASLMAWYEMGGVKTALEAQAANAELTPDQLSTINAWNQTLQGWAPTAEELAKEKAGYTGNWLDVFTTRAPHTLMMQIFLLPFFTLWRCGGLMIVGMALMKWGVFSAQRSNSFYVKCALWGLGFGLPLSILAAWDSHRNGFTMARTYLVGTNLNYLGSMGMALAYVAIVMLLHKSNILTMSNIVGKAIGSMGRMAFTNYLLQTLICTTIFYGYGFGYFAQWERWQLMFIMTPLVLLVQLFVSSLWLASFRIGPAEWVWRTLTYMKSQPIR